MRNIPTLAAAAFIVALTQGCYTQPPLGSTFQTGRVQDYLFGVAVGFLLLVVIWSAW